MEIKEIFYSEKNNKLFNKCILCEDNILEYEHGYAVEKAFKYNSETKRHETIFEYAICTECIQRSSSEMSEKSVSNIQKYLNKFRENQKQYTDNVADIEERTKICMVTNKDVYKSEEFQIAGFFIKKEMIVSDIFPYAIGEEAIEEIQNLISEKTRNFSDNFKNLILPPDIRKKLPKDRIVIF